MGMDVYGKAPANETGEYFRANIWSWRPINQLIGETKVLPEEMVMDMGMNEGAGPNAEQAKLLAYALEQAISGMDKDNEFILDDEIDGPVAAMLKELSSKGVEIVSPRGFVYSTDVEHVKEFIEFCKNSGGFEVW